MNTAFYIELLKQKAAGQQLSDENSALLGEWLAADPENEKIAGGIFAVWKGSQNYKEDFKPDKSKAWNKISSFMEQDSTVKTTPEPRVVQMKPKKPDNTWALAAALLVVVSMAVTIWWYVGQSSDMLVASTQIGETKSIELADGSQILLSENTRFEYPAEFNSDTREVKLNGEAFFNIEKNPDQPFIIESPHATTTVLGTSFVVKDFRKNVSTIVTVTSGKVKLQAKNSDKFILLEKGDQGEFNLEEKRLEKISQPDFNKIAWATQSLNFQNQALSNVLTTLENNFKISFKTQNPQLLNCPFTANFDLQNQNLDQILEAIEKALNLQITTEDGKGYVVTGEGC
jgi:ferric-dicitrate binding protein FerR (iron transport regulator)